MNTYAIYSLSPVHPVIRVEADNHRIDANYVTFDRESQPIASFVQHEIYAIVLEKKESQA